MEAGFAPDLARATVAEVKVVVVAINRLKARVRVVVLDEEDEKGDDSCD